MTSIDPLADDPANVMWSPYAYGWNDPISVIDPTGAFNEYVRDQQTGDMVMVGTKGGDDTDYIYDGTITRDEEGGVETIVHSEADKDTEVIEVEKEYTSGPGSDYTQDDDPTPGHRYIHGKSHTDIAAYAFIANLFTGGPTKNLALAAGRSGKQATMRKIASDPKQSRTILGWFKNEFRRLKYGNGGKGLRNPFNGRKSPGRKRADKGYELSHPRNAPASKGNGYNNGSKYKLHKDHKVETRLARKKGHY